MEIDPRHFAQEYRPQNATFVAFKSQILRKFDPRNRGGNHRSLFHIYCKLIKFREPLDWKIYTCLGDVIVGLVFVFIYFIYCEIYYNVNY